MEHNDYLLTTGDKCTCDDCLKQEESERIKLEMVRVGSEIRKLQGKIGGLKAHYNKLKDKLDELSR